MTCKKLSETNVGDVIYIIRYHYVYQAMNIGKLNLDNIYENLDAFFPRNNETSIDSCFRYLTLFPYGLFVVKTDVDRYYVLEGNEEIFDNKISALQNALKDVRDIMTQKYEDINKLCNEIKSLLHINLLSDTTRLFDKILSVHNKAIEEMQMGDI